MIRTTLQDEDAMRDFAAAFGQRLKAGDVVALSGPLGCGKTTFVRAAVHGLQGADPVTSPTFTFWHRYPGTPPVDHLDLFRIGDPSELAELGLEEAFTGNSIVFVEWWDNAPELLPARRYEICIAGAGDTPRIVEVCERRNPDT